MFKKRISAPGSSPATLVPHLVEGKAQKAKIHVISYDLNHFEERACSSVAEVFSQMDSRMVTWINVDGLGDIETLEALATHFKIHPLALEDVLNTGQRPKSEEGEDYLFIVSQMVYHDVELDLCGEQVSMFLGENFLITIQQEPEYDVFEHVRDRIRSGRGNIRKAKADYLAYALLDSIIDHYYPVLEKIGADIDELESRLLNNPTRDMVQTLHEHKRGLTQLRRFVWPMRDVVNSLLHDNSIFVAKTTKIYLRDCYDHTVQLMDLVESYREVSAGLMELYHSSVGLRTNEVMRVLTVITSVFIPLTFLVGVYGMNFAPETKDGKPLPLNMPELYHPYGYVALMIVMLVIAVAQLYLFRRMKWL
ncbi:MAG: magnesium/cobalt transporter CorA [Luteolibacter sp.]